MKHLIMVLLLGLSTTQICFSQNETPTPPNDMKEFTEALEKMIKDLNIDSMFIDMMNNDMPSHLKNFMDTSMHMQMFSDSTAMLFEPDMFNWQFDSTDWNRMFDETIHILEGMDFEDLENMMNSIDMSEFDKIFKEFRLMYPEIDSLNNQRYHKTREEKKLKRL